MGSDLIVVEVDPIKALQAVMDGLKVMPMIEAAREGDIFVTVTGNKNIIRKEHIKLMKDGAIIANSGHFNVEISINDLEKLTQKRKVIRPNTEEFELKNGKKIYLLAEGRLVNLASAEGHPSEVMDMSFSDQALTCRYIVENHKNLEPKVYDMPSEIGNRIAKLKLESMGINIDKLTEEQKKYMTSWKEGTL